MNTSYAEQPKQSQGLSPYKQHKLDVKYGDLAPWEWQDNLVNEPPKTPEKTANRDLDSNPSPIKSMRLKTPSSPPRKIMTAKIRYPEHKPSESATLGMTRKVPMKAATTNTDESLASNNFVNSPTPADKKMNQINLQFKQIWVNNFAKLPFSKKTEENSFRIKNVVRLHSPSKARRMVDKPDPKNRVETPQLQDQSLEMVYNAYLTNKNVSPILVLQQPMSRLRSSTASKLRKIIRKSPKDIREGLSGHQVDTRSKDQDELVLIGYSKNLNQSIEPRPETSSTVADRRTQSPWFNANCLFPKLQRKMKKVPLKLYIPDTTQARSRIEAYNTLQFRKTAKHLMQSLELDSISRSPENSIEIDHW